LFELSLDGDKSKTKWVLVVNRNPGAPAGGTGTQYFVGSFDGAKFVSETPAGKELWADYGKDFYATNSFSDIPAKDGRRIWMGWISNWQYANVEPTKLWRGAQSLLRSLQLKTFPEGIRLIQTPIQESAKLRAQQLVRIGRVSVAEAGKSLGYAGIRGDMLEIQAEILPPRAGEIGFRVRKGNGQETVIALSAERKQIFIDRTRSGEVSFSSDFPGRHSATLRWTSPIKLHIFLDRSSVELFANDGETVLTDRIYPAPQADGLELFSSAKAGKLQSLTIWKLRSIWR
jgi:fructan beta-fructosidase